MTDREELERFAAVVRQYVDSLGESKASKQAMVNGLEYVEKLTSNNSDYAKCKGCKDEKLGGRCLMCSRNFKDEYN